jgi:hypothetical protein
MGWPRLPIPEWKSRAPSPEAKRVFRQCAELGKQIHNLLTGGNSALLQAIPDAAQLRRVQDYTPVSADSLPEADRMVTTLWGISTKGRAVRSLGGEIKERPYGSRLSGQIVDLAQEMELDAGECLHRLGDNAVDVFLNPDICWSGVPKAAWEYSIGGRRVLTKWLSYRDVRVLERPLTEREIENFTDTTRRLVVLTLIGLQLDDLWPRITELV